MENNIGLASPELIEKRRLVAEARKALRAVRTITRNERLGRYSGRNEGATTAALGRNSDKATKAMEQLPAHIANALREEHCLTARISQYKDENGVTGRPELKRRIRGARSILKGLI